MCCGQFGSTSATRSPLRTPSRRRPSAARAIWSPISRYVVSRPKNSRATAFACRWMERSTMSTRDPMTGGMSADTPSA